MPSYSGSILIAFTPKYKYSIHARDISVSAASHVRMSAMFLLSIAVNEEVRFTVPSNGILFIPNSVKIVIWLRD
jgi:hypothetical protein